MYQEGTVRYEYNSLKCEFYGVGPKPNGEIPEEVEKVLAHGPCEHLYPGEIASIVLLGDGRYLKWKQEGNKLIVCITGTKRGNDANVLKIRRNQIYRDE